MRNGNSIFMTLLTIGGGYALWRNRYRVQSFLESRGFSLPRNRDEVREQVRSGFSKVKERMGTTDSEHRRVG